MTKRSVTASLRRALRRGPEPAGIVRIPAQELASLTEEDRQTIEQSIPYTMTGVAAAACARRGRPLLRDGRDPGRSGRVRRLARRLRAGDDLDPAEHGGRGS